MMNMALVFCFYSGERPSGVIPQVVRPEVTGRVLTKETTTVIDTINLIVLNSEVLT